MLSKISLENYKSFQTLNELEIKPLTILCGANSSGKSSIIKSILLHKQSYENSSASNKLTLNGDYTNNGIFSDVAYNASSTFSISNTFILNSPFTELSRYGKAKKQSGITEFKELLKLFGKRKEDVLYFELCNCCTYKAQSPPKKSNILDHQNMSIICHLKDSESLVSNYEIKHTNRTLGYSLKWSNLPDTKKEIKSGSLKQCIIYFSGLQIKNIYSDSIPSGIMISEIIPSIITLSRTISEQYKHIHYIGPLRTTPQRQYIALDDIFTVGTSGENTALLLNNIREKNISYIMPPLDSVAFSNKDSIKSVSDKFLNALNIWLEYMNITQFEIRDIEELVKLSFSGSNIADVGFGISQILPILVESLNSISNDIIVLEQPEIHLHPKMQMNFADFIISNIFIDRNTIIETHSDHIINRIVRRIMEENSDYLLKNVKIYFVNKTSTGSKIEEIKIDKMLGIVDCPEDFFSQYASETDLIIRQGFQNIQKKRG